MPFRCIAAVICLALVIGCATQPGGNPQDVAAAQDLREARSTNLSTEERATHYLDAAALTAPRLGTGTQSTPARETYNTAAAELTVLLRSADGGRLWNHPLKLASGNETYHLRLQPAGPATWSPDYFNFFAPSAVVKEDRFRKNIVQPGVGGTLVGVRQLTPRENFAPPRGISAPVTATLDFKTKEAELALRRPARQPVAPVDGVTRPLAADFSAPLRYYRPPDNLFLVGIMGTLRSGNYMGQTGLYFLQPYDPDRIPVVFVHGLISTPFTWIEAINELQADPEIRKHYQFWVFAYPTGNPILYSALRLREELARADKLYPNHRPYVLVGHSMGGMLTRAQVTNVTRPMWEKEIGDPARTYSRATPPVV